MSENDFNDELIEKTYSLIPNEQWRLVFGLMAAYGLRNHEVFFCDLSCLKNGGDKILRGTTFTKYKQFVQNCFKALPRQALHATRLEFIHPKKNKLINFEIPLPDDMLNVLDRWRKYIINQLS